MAFNSTQFVSRAAIPLDFPDQAKSKNQLKRVEKHFKSFQVFTTNNEIDMEQSVYVLSATAIRFHSTQNVIIIS